MIDKVMVRCREKSLRDYSGCVKDTRVVPGGIQIRAFPSREWSTWLRASSR